jgi:hypothetical protein
MVVNCQLTVACCSLRAASQAAISRHKVSSRFGRVKGLVESHWRVSVEIVHYQHDLVRFGKEIIDQVSHTMSKVGMGSPFCHPDVTPPRQGLKEHKTNSAPTVGMHHLFFTPSSNAFTRLYQDLPEKVPALTQTR